MNILITGGTTFVSKYTAEYFADRGNDVYVINRGTREQIPNVKHIKCDRMNIGNKLKNIHFDVVLDITAYNDEHIKSLINALGSFDDYIFISSNRKTFDMTNLINICFCQISWFHRLFLTFSSFYNDTQFAGILTFNVTRYNFIDFCLECIYITRRHFIQLLH